MSKNDPPNPAPANIQMTPVEFSPQTSDAIGSVGGRLPVFEMEFPLSIPVTIMLVTLIFSTVRDISGFNRRIDDIAKADAPAVETLKNAPKQTDFVMSLQTGLQKLATTDPGAAQIVREFFPPPPPLKPDGQAGGASTPPK